MILIVLLIGGGIYGYQLQEEKKRAEEEMERFLNETAVFFLAGDKSTVTVFNEEWEEAELIRGSAVDVKINKEVETENEEEETVYREIIFHDKTYYVQQDMLAEDRNDCVREKSFFVQRDMVLFQEPYSAKIVGSLSEGAEVSVEGFHELREDGTVDYYLLHSPGGSGYIKGDKNHLDTSFTSIAYDSSIYPDKEGYGGCAQWVKYYPKEEIHFQDNEMPEVVKSLYINADKVRCVDEFLNVASQCGINAFVVDIKDTHILSYDSDVVHSYSPNSNVGINSKDAYAECIRKLKDAGYYVIGRITVFKDPHFAEDNPDTAIMSGEDLYRYNSSYWPSIYSRKVWEYNVSLAKEAVEWFGFHEIQFDYVRTPEVLPSNADMHNIYGESKVEAITRFIRYAVEVLHEIDTYVSVDVFGEVANGYVTNYGQYWPAISNAADVISGMPYPDHFGKGYYGISMPWKEPYQLMYSWGSAAMECQSITYDGAKIRTWIQAYDSVVDATVYDASMIAQQIAGLNDAGIIDGYITWNGGASYQKFATYISVLK